MADIPLAPWMLPVIKQDALVASFLYVKIIKFAATAEEYKVSLDELILPKNAPANQRHLFESCKEPPNPNPINPTS